MASVNSASVSAKYPSPPLGDYYSNYVAAASSMASDPSALKFGYSDPSKAVPFAFGFPQHPDSFSALSYNGTLVSMILLIDVEDENTNRYLNSISVQVQHRENSDVNEQHSVALNWINSKHYSIELVIRTFSCAKKLR